MMIERRLESFDYDDNRTYNFEEYANEFAEGEQVNTRPRYSVKVRDQGQSPACTRYACVHVNNGQNIIEYAKNGLSYTQLNPIDVWNRGDKRKYAINALDQLKKEGLIEGYTAIKKDANMAANMRRAFAMNCYIVTGSYNGTRGILRKPYMYKERTDGKIVGHLFGIVEEAEPDLWRCINSFGEDWGDKGYFYMTTEQIKKNCFNLYVPVDKDDTGKFQIFKMKEKAKQFIALAKELYSNGDKEIREFFNNIQLSTFINDKYMLK